MTTIIYINEPEFIVTTGDIFNFESLECLEQLSEYAYNCYKQRDIDEVNVDNIEYLPGNLQKVHISVTFN